MPNECLQFIAQDTQSSHCCHSLLFQGKVVSFFFFSPFFFPIMHFITLAFHLMFILKVSDNCRSLQDNNFVQIQTPVITSNDCEGAGELFQVAVSNTFVAIYCSFTSLILNVILFSPLHSVFNKI